MTERTLVTSPESVNWPIPKDFEGIMSYNPRHDIQDFLDLQNLHGRISNEEFAEEQVRTINRTKRQLEKTLGERFRVRSSRIDYFIQDGILKNPDYPEPVLKRYEKGVKFLRENGSTETERELAELQGMRVIEKIFSGEELKTNDKVIIVSPRGPKGTLYNDNYFDVYQKVNGEIEMTRYHSTHDHKGFLEAARQANQSFPKAPDGKLDAAYFLQNPIITTQSTDQILETFALDVNTQIEDFNNKIVEACLPYINYYIRVLTDNPFDFEEIEKTINTIYYIADKTDKLKKSRVKIESKAYYQLEQQDHKHIPFTSIRQEIDLYGRQPVRPVNNGCPGGQKGFKINQSSFLLQLSNSIGARSVADFADYSSGNEDEYGTLDIHCEECHSSYQRTPHKLEEKCRNCGGTKGIAC